MTDIEQNKTVVRDFIDGLFTKGDPGAVDDFLAEDFVNHDPPFGASADREGMRNAAAMFRSAFPDWHSVPHRLVAEDDIVVEHFTASGTPRRDHGGGADRADDHPARDQHLPGQGRPHRRAMGTPGRPGPTQPARSGGLP